VFFSTRPLIAGKEVTFLKFPGMTPNPNIPSQYSVALIDPMMVLYTVIPVEPNVTSSNPYSAYAEPPNRASVPRL
jgi:hypothetical protein